MTLNQLAKGNVLAEKINSTKAAIAHAEKLIDEVTITSLVECRLNIFPSLNSPIVLSHEIALEILSVTKAMKTSELQQLENLFANL